VVGAVIVSRRPAGLVLVRQVDHQDQCALMAEAWGGAGWARPEPYGPLALAGAIHDEGWREWEEAPRVADGAPVDFADIDRPTHVALYTRAIDAARRRDPRAGLLVSLHGQGLYEGRRGLDPGPATPRSERPPEVRAFLAAQDRVQAELREEIGGGPELERWAWDAYRLLQTWDTLSLYLTWRALAAGREGGLPQVPREPGDEGVELRLRPAGPWTAVCEPWPFAGDRVDLPVRARVIPDRRYAGDADLATALAGTPWTTLALSVERASPPGT
jgi:hypothetical protein